MAIKQKYFKRLIRVVLLISVILLVGFIILIYNVKFRMSDSEYVEQISDNNTKVTIDYHPYEKHEVRNILVDRGHDRLFILLHGSPSSSAQWTPLVNDTLLSHEVDFLLVDRPGYGYSNFGNPILEVKKQAEIVYEIITKYAKKYQQLLMLGTSYGGTVAARFMMDYPDYLDAGILMSSSLAPGEERIYDVSYSMERFPWLFPTFLIIANQEKLSHYDQLKKMEPYWGNITNPILFIHATADDLVFPTNVPFALSHLNPNVSIDTTWVKDGEHSLYWSDRVLVFRELYRFVEKYNISK